MPSRTIRLTIQAVMDLPPVLSGHKLVQHPAPPFRFLAPPRARASSFLIRFQQYASVPAPFQSARPPRRLASAILPLKAVLVVFFDFHKPPHCRAGGALKTRDHDW